MSTRDPYDTDAQRHGWWLLAGVAGLIAVALFLLGATFWLSQGEEPPVAAATGASEVVDTPALLPMSDSSVTPAPAVPSGSPGQGSDVAGEAVSLAELPAVPLSEEVAPVPGVVFSVHRLEAVEGGGNGGSAVPAVRFTLTVRNESGAPLTLGAADVQLLAGTARQPADALVQSAAEALPGTIAAGATGAGVFTFAVPAEMRDPVRILVGYAAGVPIAAFEGAAPR